MWNIEFGLFKGQKAAQVSHIGLSYRLMVLDTHMFDCTSSQIGQEPEVDNKWQNLLK